MGSLRTLLVFLTSALLFTSCVTVPLSTRYLGPPERPSEVENYYSTQRSNFHVEQLIVAQTEHYTHKSILLETKFGETRIDFYERSAPSSELILVFPLLGGSNTIADYFAQYFAANGIDAAIVNRSDDFKDPELFPKLEEVFRTNVIRDRIALDFFEKEYGKKSFGSFGISRGAINVAITAGVDKRLRYNVMALGATDLIRIMKKSNENRIISYRNRVKKIFNISDEQFFTQLRANIKTDPKYLSGYIDARDTLLILGALDKTVPIQYGVKLRRQIGGPKTIYLLADHYLSGGFTQLASSLSSTVKRVGFPFDYIEGEALSFYREKMKIEDSGSLDLADAALDTAQAPGNLLARIIDRIF
jgi:hypothetical protein